MSQVAFRLDVLKQVRLAARRAENQFFERARVDWSYSRTVHAGRGLLFVVHGMTPSPAWRGVSIWRSSLGLLTVARSSR